MARDIEKELYTYKALIFEVYDGDTVTADIELGFNINLNDVKIRLLRINTPELRGEEKEEGLKSRDYLRSLILDKEVIIKSQLKSKDNFGRILAEIYTLDGLNINDLLVSEGYAEYKHY